MIYYNMCIAYTWHIHIHSTLYTWYIHTHSTLYTWYIHTHSTLYTWYIHTHSTLYTYGSVIYSYKTSLNMYRYIWQIYTIHSEGRMHFKSIFYRSANKRHWTNKTKIYFSIQRTRDTELIKLKYILSFSKQETLN